MVRVKSNSAFPTKRPKLPRIIKYFIFIMLGLFIYQVYRWRTNSDSFETRQLTEAVENATIRDILSRQLTRLLSLDIPVVEDVGEAMTRLWFDKQDQFCHSVKSQSTRQDSHHYHSLFAPSTACQSTCDDPAPSHDHSANQNEGRRRHLIIIPFRDRLHHLGQLLPKLDSMLTSQGQCSLIAVVEQANSQPFNKGKLMNAGFVEALTNWFPFNCVTFHDVDLMPIGEETPYNCPTFPRHASLAIDKFDFKLPYMELIGGVLTFPIKAFLRVNGFSNLYWGWGAEDDDMYRRLMATMIPLTRLNTTHGRFKMLEHVPSPRLPENIRANILSFTEARYRLDGLNSLNYSLLSSRVYAPNEALINLLPSTSISTPLLHLVVDVGQPEFPFVIPL